MTKRQALKVVRKLGLEERKGKELFFKLVHDDRTILTTAIPKGRGELHIERQFRDQLRLSEEQLAEAVRCPFKERHYLRHLSEIGLLPGEPPTAS